MRILLDECIPRLLKRDIVGHEVATVAELGWAGIKNGRLLDLAEGRFDVLLTVDRSIEYQQNLQDREIALLGRICKLHFDAHPLAAFTRGNPSLQIRPSFGRSQ